MTKRVSFDVAPIPIHDALPWSDASLENIVEQTLVESHQYGHYEPRTAGNGDVRLVIGASGDGLIMHGSGWVGYCGTDPSTLAPSDETNPFGAAFSVIRGAAELQRNPRLEHVRKSVTDTFLWDDSELPSNAVNVTPDFEIGELWSVGVGSVGSAALYFLSLISRAFQAVLVDGDRVELENVTRSPSFTWRHGLEEPWKVDAVGSWLREAGVKQVEPFPFWLHEIPERWVQREAGSPDVLIAAANERNVRNLIEDIAPPLQVYATTGRNWQATLFRHIPILEACSLCVTGAEGQSGATLCATGTSDSISTGEDNDDVALPFLSYAAGLMSAAEIAKIAIVGNPVTTNRVFFEPAHRGLYKVALNKKADCVCGRRDHELHHAAIAGSRFAALSDR